MAKSEGNEVRKAYDGPSVEHDALIDQIEVRSKEEYARASDASESGAKLKDFLEETGFNGQAFGWLKAIMKKMPKKDGQAKAMDIIRSLEVGLPMIKAHVAGQATAEMDFTEPAEPADDALESPDADFDAQMAEALDDQDPAYDGDDPETAEESEKFLADVDANMGDAA